MGEDVGRVAEKGRAAGAPPVRYAMQDMLERCDLGVGERPLWDGRPVRHRLFWPSDVFLIPLSVAFCAFALFWTSDDLPNEQRQYLNALPTPVIRDVPEVRYVRDIDVSAQDRVRAT